jgi:hypothetical protein
LKPTHWFPSAAIDGASQPRKIGGWALTPTLWFQAAELTVRAAEVDRRPGLEANTLVSKRRN